MHGNPGILLPLGGFDLDGLGPSGEKKFPGSFPMPQTLGIPGNFAPRFGILDPVGVVVSTADLRPNFLASPISPPKKNGLN